jgi:hypothetical protein
LIKKRLEIRKKEVGNLQTKTENLRKREETGEKKAGNWRPERNARE